jgi:hypothetical protein
MKTLEIEQEMVINIVKNLWQEKSPAIDPEILNKLDWEQLLKTSIKHKILPQVYTSIHTLIPLKHQASYEQEYFKIIYNNRLMMSELSRILYLAKQNNIEVILLKGLTLSKFIYNDLNARQFNDIDLLVNEFDMEKMYYMLSDIGYLLEAGFDKNTNRPYTLNKPILMYGKDFHEFKCIKDVGNGSYIIVEIKRASSAISLRFISDFLLNVKNIEINGVNVRSLNLLYSFLHLSSNFYENFETYLGVKYASNLRDAVDTYMFILKYMNELDWAQIRRLSNKYESTHKIYCVFLRLIETFGDGFIAKDIVELFNPSKVTYKYDGNYDGSLYAWKSSFVSRLFNADDRYQEFCKLAKLNIYQPKYYNHFEKVEKNSFSTIMNTKLFQHFYIESLHWDIEYLFTYDGKNLYLYLFMDIPVYEQLTNYKIMIFFIDNNFENSVYQKIITITINDEFEVLYNGLAKSPYQSFELGAKKCIKIIFPLENLDVNLKESQNHVFYNLHLWEKIGSLQRIIEEKYNIDDIQFIKFPDEFFVC